MASQQKQPHARSWSAGCMEPFLVGRRPASTGPYSSPPRREDRPAPTVARVKGKRDRGGRPARPGTSEPLYQLPPSPMRNMPLLQFPMSVEDLYLTRSEDYYDDPFEDVEEKKLRMRLRGC